MLAALSRRFYAFCKCRSLQLQRRTFVPMFPNYAQKFGGRLWMPSGKWKSTFLASSAREEEEQVQALQAAQASAGAYGGGCYSHRISLWPHFTIAASSAAAAADGLSDVPLHWLQIQSLRALRTAAAEFFAHPKRLRYPPPRILPVGRRTIRLQGGGGGSALSFLCAGVFVQAAQRGHQARRMCTLPLPPPSLAIV
jgi:hypothetical protein